MTTLKMKHAQSTAEHVRVNETHRSSARWFRYLATGIAIIVAAHLQATTISNADTSLNGSQKYVLRVDGKPWMMTNVQVRLDKLRYYWGWDATARAGIIAQAASDGFNTVTIPIHWYEVEPTMNSFDWTILDEYLGIVKANNLKMEMIWFGQNSGGHVQWLGDTNVNPVHLRTPDYVLYSPNPSSNSTTSNYTIIGTRSNPASYYTLDLADANMQARETYVLGQVMAHIASWDAANQNPHTVVGVQILNECSGFNGYSFSDSLVISYISGLASAVKSSTYSVWTRLNCVNGVQTGRINANETLRNGAGTNLDFCGVDIYGAGASSFKTTMPTIGKNYKMYMEAGGESSSCFLFPLSSLSGSNAFDYYDMAGPDGHELYDRVGTMGWTPHGTYINDVRTVNRLIDGAQFDLALNAHGSGLFVHNFDGSSTASSTGVAGVSFTPSTTTSQGVSIVRSSSELVLINTKGGTFNYPSTLAVTGASQGYFDSNNAWVNQGSVSFTSTSITPPVGTIVRLTATVPLTFKYEAESLAYTVTSGVSVETWNDGASGGAWKKILSHAVGNYVEFTVNVTTAGTYEVRTAVKTGNVRGIAQLAVNGVNQGSPIDMYAATSTFVEKSSGLVTFSTPGTYALRYTVTGKNASSTDYTMGFDYILLKQ